MTYGNQTAARPCYTYKHRRSTQLSETRRKMVRLRAIRRALHFVGFLCYWAVILAAGYLAMLAFMIAMILLS